MSLTAAVINAGIGDLSLGLNMAGFHIAVAFESDERAAAIHRSNLHNEVIPLSLEQIEPGMMPNVDLLAARIKLSSRNSPVQDHAATNLLHLLECHRPRCLFLIFDSASPNRDRFNYFLDQLAKIGYRFQYRKVDVAQAIGIPVKESILYLVGTVEYGSESIPDIFFQKSEPAPIHAFLRYDDPVDPWYYQIKFDRTPIEEHGRPLLCWRNNCYIDADIVQWNTAFSADEFFTRCLNGTLTENDFDFRKNGQSEKEVKGAVRDKIIALPDFLSMIGKPLLAEESFVKNRVHCSFAATDKSATVGFIAANKSKPMTLLRSDRLDHSKSAVVDLVLRRPYGTPYFDEIILGDEEVIDKYIDYIEPLLAENLRQENPPVLAMV